MKANGAARPKVFKLRMLALAPGGRAEVTRTISLAVHTTRRPHPGRHELELRVNGVAPPGARFEVGRARRVAPRPPPGPRAAVAASAVRRRGGGDGRRRGRRGSPAAL